MYNSSSPEQFYDNLASSYHLIYENWEDAVKKHGAIIDELIEQYVKFEKNKIKLLDCTCGIGTQAIGLALLNYNVKATDISPKAIERAKHEAKRLKAEVSFDVSDIRDMADIPGDFDVIISFDNSLPHLLNINELELALKGIKDKIKDSGLFIASIRDYDSLIKERPSSTPLKVIEYCGEKRVTFQIWEWENNLYTVNHYIVIHSKGKIKTIYNQTTYRALLRDELTSLLKKVGFQKILWIFPEESKFYQPIVLAFT